MKLEPLESIKNKIIKTIKNNKIKIIYLSPQGKKINQIDIKKISIQKYITLLCGRNKGIDERFIKYFIDKELSIGDYIVNNGDISAYILTNAIKRFQIIKKKITALEQNTFKNNIFDYPCYTKPRIFNKFKIPKILTHGNHIKLDVWKILHSKKKLGFTDQI